MTEVLLADGCEKQASDGVFAYFTPQGRAYACSGSWEQLHCPYSWAWAARETAVDNAVAESLFKTMKAEMVYHYKFATRQ